LCQKKEKKRKKQIEVEIEATESIVECSTVQSATYKCMRADGIVTTNSAEQMLLIKALHTRHGVSAKANYH
jgi:hypothetical protein